MPEQQFSLFIEYPNDAALIFYTAIPGLMVESNKGVVALRSETSKLTVYIQPDRQVLILKALGFMEKRIELNGLSARQAKFYRVNEKEETYTTEKGSYLISSIPEGAMLQIDGIPSFKELTPYELNNYEAKKYRINISKTDYYPLDTLIEIRQGMKQSGVFNLRSKFGTLSLKAQVPVKVRVNTTDYDVGPEIRSIRLIEGTYSLNMIDPLYFPYSEEIRIFSGQTIIKVIPLKSVYGTLVLKSEMPVKVKINNTFEDIGPTPKSLPLKVGEYTLSVNDPRMEPWTEKVSLNSGETRNLELSLIKRVGYLNILNTDVFDYTLNGEYREKKAGAAMVELFEGTYQAEVKRQGYLPEIFSFTIQKGDVVNWEPVFKLVTVTVNLQTEPTGATIQLIRGKEKKLLGFSPVVEEVAIGEVEFLIKREGYTDYRFTAQLEEGKAFNKSINLSNPSSPGNNVVNGIRYGQLVYNGFTYTTVVIGTQEWTVENLRTTTYNDGTPIEKITDISKWTKTNDGAFCAYDNNESNVKTYGYLYNWYAVNTGKLAPSGWRVPGDEDWTKLEEAVGGSDNAGTKLKAKSGWESNGNGTDDFGFNVMPSGCRYNDDGSSNDIGYFGYFWSSTANDIYVWRRDLHYNNSSLLRFDDDRRSGFSIRLVRDVN